MKNLFLSFILIILGMFFVNMPSFCADTNSSAEWSDMLEFDRSWRTNQEAVSDEEFEKVMKRFEKKKKPKKYEFEANETRDSLNDMSILNEIANHSPIILFPTNLRSYEGEYIPAGYYKINCVSKNNKHYIVVTQGRKVYATLDMQQSSEDFKSDSIQFAEIRPFNDEMMKLIYGNLDLNLEKNLYIVN